MKTEKQRIAIAEACGWVKCHECDDSGGCAFWWKHDEGRTGRATHFLPDYLNDLNAIHGAFALQPRPVQEQIVEILVAAKPSSSPEMAVAYSTSEEWAEALLRTLGLWKD